MEGVPGKTLKDNDSNRCIGRKSQNLETELQLHMGSYIAKYWEIIKFENNNRYLNGQQPEINSKLKYIVNPMCF